MAKIVNLTPNSIKISTSNGIVKIPASGWELQLVMETEHSHLIFLADIGWINVTRTTFGAPTLIEGKGRAKIEKPYLYEPDTLFVVSQFVLNGLKNNPFIVNKGQFIAPAEVHRDKTGKITYYENFSESFGL